MYLAILALSLAQAPPSAEAYAALVREYDEGLAAFRKAFDAAKTADDKAKAFRDKHPRVEDFAPRFLALATKAPAAPVAVEALTWVALHPAAPESKAFGLRAKALETLGRDHARDERVGRLCTLLVQAADPAAEDFLRAVLAGAKLPGVKARACASLGQNLKYRARVVRQIQGGEASAAPFEAAWGKAAIAKLLTRKPDEMAGEAVKLFKRVEKEFAGVPHPTHGSLGKFAERTRLSLEQPVTVGEAAPEIVGEDIDGKAMKLSDFKGKAVLLAFWSAGLTGRTTFAEDRELLRRWAGKPFALVGVNADGDRKALKGTLSKEKVEWRSWWDGGGAGGPIATRWEVEALPTFAVIDGNGVVRRFFFGRPSEKDLDAEVSKWAK